MASWKKLDHLTPGMPLLVGGDRIVEVSQTLAEAFRPGDKLFVVPTTGEILHIPESVHALTEQAVGRAHRAFGEMRNISDEAISAFYADFAARLADDEVWNAIGAANIEDVAQAQARGRSTTRLVADEQLRTNVIAGLKGWLSASSARGRVLETVQHESWNAELVAAELGVVGFVFEGRPNVVADATGVLRGGNTVVFRIGSDALRTAKAILEHALEPALRSAGLPAGAVSLVESPSHAAGWAMFGDSRLSLAVARGSGEAVETLGAVARTAGIPVSLHGTGGAWMVVSEGVTPERVTDVVSRSLDRKVCNTLNTLCLVQSEAERLLPAILLGMERAGAARGQTFKLHVASSDGAAVPQELFNKRVQVVRAEGPVEEPQAELISDDALGREWEWEETPEVTLKLVASTDEAVSLFNQQSPQFVATLLSSNPDEHERFYQTVNAPFVGDGFTRWVDGQFALKRPELGLSNWQHGRLFARGGVLSGDSVFTVRTRARGH